jgi:hypothetical protein
LEDEARKEAVRIRRYLAMAAEVRAAQSAEQGTHPGVEDEVRKEAVRIRRYLAMAAEVRGAQSAEQDHGSWCGG